MKQRSDRGRVQLNFRFFFVAAVWVLGACDGCFGIRSPVDQPGSTLAKSCDDTSPKLEPQQLDVLFVIDNSNSMREEQEGVARELTSFVSELRVSGGVAQDIRVGVITTTVYQRIQVGVFADYRDCQTNSAYCTQSGKLQPVPDVNPDGGVLAGTGSERVLNSDDPQFVEKFARLVQQGTHGSGQETPFEALRLALFDWQKVSVAEGGNGGFLRDGARLLIVVLTDEDDCSESVRPPKTAIGDQPNIDYCSDNSNLLVPVQEYFDVFNSLTDSTGKRKEIIYTTIGPVGKSTKVALRADDPAPPHQVRNIDCETSNQPGYRHRAMAQLFYADLANLDSICKPNYRETLVNIAGLAGVPQSLQIAGVSDPHTLQVIITRKSGAQQVCSYDSKGFSWDPPNAKNPLGTIIFGSDCKRRRDDQSIKIERLCIY